MIMDLEAEAIRAGVAACTSWEGHFGGTRMLANVVIDGRQITRYCTITTICHPAIELRLLSLQRATLDRACILRHLVPIINAQNAQGLGELEGGGAK